jgi:peptidoglycan/LPS O-acetylase OafA/YrhL
VVLFGHATLFLSGDSAVERINLPVDFFFTLSGFVIAFSYELKLIHGLSPALFLFRRAIRLCPPSYRGTFGDTILRLDQPAHSKLPSVGIAICVGHTNFLDAPFSFGRFPVNQPEWSLFYELILYAPRN